MDRHEKATKTEASKYGKDDDIPARKFKSGEDDCASVFHEARWLRMPVVEPRRFWSEIPMTRTPIYRHLPLHYYGADMAVAEEIIIAMHDRRKVVKIKAFSNHNLRAKRGDDAATESAIRWLQEALYNLSIVTAFLWPMDFTPANLMRFLSSQKWGAAARSDGGQLAADFVDRVLELNTGRATRKQPPMPFDKYKDLYERMRDEGNFSSEKPSRPRAEKSGQSAKQGKERPAPSKAEPLRPTAKAHGWPVCYAFNSTKACTRPMETGGLGCIYVLADGREIRYAHACSQWLKVEDKYCLGGHSRADHK